MSSSPCCRPTLPSPSSRETASNLLPLGPVRPSGNLLTLHGFPVIYGYVTTTARLTDAGNALAKFCIAPQLVG